VILFRNNVYILGAGFSANAGAPVMKNFVEQAKLLLDDPRLGLPDEDKKTFERVFKRLAELRVAQARMTIDIENIEHLFSLLDMDMEFGGNATTPAPSLRQDLIFLILRTLEKTIQTGNLPRGGYGLPFFMGDGKPKSSRGVEVNYVEMFSALVSRRWITGTLGMPQDGKCQDTVITLNYDCLLDDCLAKIGVLPEYGLQNAEPPKELRQCGREISVLKLHGSANWFKCKSGRCTGTVIDGRTPAKRLEYFYGQRCPNCHQDTVEPVIVPPTWAKGGQSEVLRPVWAKALEALREAGRIFIIGYSMPSTDQFFRYMLALALAANEKLDRVVVVNTSEEAQKTFQDLFHSEFGRRKLKRVDLAIGEYAVRAGNDGLGFELGQFQEGLDQSMIESSGFRFQ